MPPAPAMLRAVLRLLSRFWPSSLRLQLMIILLPVVGLPILATGYMLKDSSAEEILNALRQAHDGTSSLSPRIAAMLVRHVRSSSTGTPSSSDLAPLTGRENEVLGLLARGMSNAEMADTLLVSEGTIKAHLGSIISKWHVRDRVQVLVAAARTGLVHFD